MSQAGEVEHPQVTNATRRRPIAAIVAAVVGGLMLLGQGLYTAIAFEVYDDVPWEPADYAVVAILIGGAGLSFASAGLAGRRPFAAGALAGLAALPAIVGLIASGLVDELLEEPGALLESMFFGAVIVLGIVASVLFQSGPCILAAILNFRRWGQDRRAAAAATDSDEDCSAP